MCFGSWAQGVKTDIYSFLSLSVTLAPLSHFFLDYGWQLVAHFLILLRYKQMSLF